MEGSSCTKIKKKKLHRDTVGIIFIRGCEMQWGWRGWC